VSGFSVDSEGRFAKPVPPVRAASLDATPGLLQVCAMTRLRSIVGAFPLVNPVICGSGEPVMTEAGIRAALRAGAAGVVAKSVNEHPQAGRQLDRADYVRLDASGAPTAGPGVSLFNRSGLTQRGTADWFAAIAAIDREVQAEGKLSLPALSTPDLKVPCRSRRRRGMRGFGCSN
jgi:dihydroorotate dehydrogenase